MYGYTIEDCEGEIYSPVGVTVTLTVAGCVHTICFFRTKTKEEAEFIAEAVLNALEKG